jgi:hypothetical protein
MAIMDVKEKKKRKEAPFHCIDIRLSKISGNSSGFLHNNYAQGC